VPAVKGWTEASGWGWGAFEHASLQVNFNMMAAATK
jgi:hypothetical protein